MRGAACPQGREERQERGLIQPPRLAKRGAYADQEVVLRTLIAALTSLLCATAAPADPVDQKSARKMLFNARGFDVQYIDSGVLTDQQLGFFRTLVNSRDSRSQFGQLAQYYGAIAISPSVFESSITELFTRPETVPFAFPVGYHSVSAAQAAALSLCNANVARGQKPCVLAVQIVPKRFKPVALTLSSAATEAFRTYRRAKAPKAFAMSQSTGAFGQGDGPLAVETALRMCNAAVGEGNPEDCVVVIADEN